MKPKLRIVKKKFNFKQRRAKRVEVTRFYFSVVDSEVKKGYPFNYICMLPKIRSAFCGRPKNLLYVKIFGSGLELPLKLLREALENPSYTQDPEIKAEIEKRIEVLERKPNYERKREVVYA